MTVLVMPSRASVARRSTRSASCSPAAPSRSRGSSARSRGPRAARRPARWSVPRCARGRQCTATTGTSGCAAAAARLLALDLGQVRHAMGLAAALASVLKENFGSMTKPYHAGHAARNGVLAALLAREGLTASESALDGKQGFLEATGTAPVPAAALATALDGLGQRWHVLETGVAVKPYPSCALTHSAIDALLDLRTRHGFAADQVAGI